MAKRRRRADDDREFRIRDARTMLMYGLRLAGEPVPVDLSEMDAHDLARIARRHRNRGGFRHALTLLEGM